MNIDELFALYVKERQYQEKIFGSYSDQKHLSFASFIVFLDEYVQKMKRAYCSSIWSGDLPNWLEETEQSRLHEATPVAAYEELIKIFALSGAALETYTEINPSRWRENGVKEKWEKE